VAEPGFEDSECHSYESRKAWLSVSEAEDNLEEGDTTGKYIDDNAEALLLQVAAQPLRDVLILMRDMGFRPEEVFRMRWDHVHWEKRVYFNPYGKTQKSRRWVPISERATEVMKMRLYNQSIAKPTRRGRPLAASQPCKWVFPSKRAKSGHLTTVAKRFARQDDWLDCLNN